MKKITFARSIALLAVASLAACGGGSGSSGTASSLPITPPIVSGNAMFARFVGVGDSLTAGFQSGGLLGVNGTNPLSILPGNIVPQTQENGYWALMYEQATGTTPAQMANPTTSVLPLINAPGLGAQLIPTNPAVTGAPFVPTQQACDAFNMASYSAAGFSTVRINPGGAVLDVAVPGITAHEAVNMTNPITGPQPGPVGGSCPGYASSATDPTAGALQSLVSGESSDFIPVLGSYLSQSQVGRLTNGQPSTMVNAAASVKPTFATVWLGANDILKYTFSGGQAQLVDQTQGQMQSDVQLAITTLQKAGAQGVAVANLPTVLETPQFFRGGTPPALAACATQNWLFCDLVAELTPIFEGPPYNLPPANAQAQAQSVAGQLVAYIATTYSVTSNGYLTETGFFAVLKQAAGGSLTPKLDPNGAGSGLGGAYITDAFAAQVNAYNAAFNAGIAAAASNTGTALVDINTLFNDLYNGNVSNPEVAAAFSINPAVNPNTGAFTCCSLVFGQGLLGFDGLHPSNTGYALIANAWIAAIDAKYSTANIPPLSFSTIQTQIYPFDPYAPH